MFKRSGFKGVITFLEKFLPLLCVLFFILGIWASRISEGFADFVDRIIGGFVNWYIYIAPFAIYIILTPSFSKILSEKNSNGKGFVRYSLIWFARYRLAACLWACIFTAFIFGFPVFINHSVSLGGAILKSFKSMLWMFSHSVYFYAIYASAITVLISTKVKKLENVLSKGPDLVERVGNILVAIVPIFMLLVGSYVAHLPTNVSEQIGEKGLSIHLNTINILGLKISSYTKSGMVFAYLAGAFLTGIACFIWHIGLLLIAKTRSKNFSILDYFKDYWAKVYPLLWATSSEALATPLNLYLIQKHYNKIRREVSSFVVGVGSFMNINGTMICVFIMAGLVCSLLGVQISLVDLLMSIPIVFLIGYGVPGIPGELLLFGGPIAVLLRISPESVPIFLALYLGLQIGLPDSFRTGANSTDVCVSAVILEDIYEKKFLLNSGKEKIPLLPGTPVLGGVLEPIKLHKED